MSIALQFVVTVLDSKGRLARGTVYFDYLDDIAGKDGEIAWEVAKAFDSLIDGQVVQIRKSVNNSLPGTIKGAPLAGCSVEHKAVFTFRAGRYPIVVTLPSFKPSLFVPYAKEVDIIDPDVAAFIDQMVNGFVIDDVDWHPRSNRDEVITEFVSAREAFMPRKGD